jgi:hypothetical protein
MIAEPAARISQDCTGCGWKREITKDDLARAIRNRQLGPALSLWGRHRPCPQCGKPTSYFASHAPGARMRRLDDADAADQIARLHETWRLFKSRL